MVALVLQALPQEAAPELHPLLVLLVGTIMIAGSILLALRLSRLPSRMR